MVNRSREKIKRKKKKEQNCKKNDSERKSREAELAGAGRILRNILIFKKLID